jgi:hypothetical protein
MKKIFFKNPLLSVIEKESDDLETELSIYLLVCTPDNLRLKTEFYINKKFEDEKIKDLNFVICVPPIIGGERKMAELVDFIYTKCENVTNLSKKEYLSLGTSFYDFKALLQIMQPERIITLQNSYKNSKFFNYLP